MPTRLLTLLRGINVGGNNIIKMADLKACFEAMGFTNVVTYIQSGNVLFDAEDADTNLHTSVLEQRLSEQFAYASRIVLITQEKLLRIIQHAPDGFGVYPETYRYDVIFLRPPVSAAEALSKIKTKEGVDFVTAGEGVLYFSRLSSKSLQSHMTKLIGTAIYKEMTIRNWNTTTRLAEL